MNYSKLFGGLISTTLYLFVCATITLADDPPANEAERLVKRALQAELSGLSRTRDELLTEAINLDPSFAPARWHSGQVLMTEEDGQEHWMSIKDAEKTASQNPLLAQYAKMRLSKADDATGNEALAKWCQRRGLAERAKVHWARVLKYQPNHQTAFRRLDLKKYQGRWFTQTQVAEIKKQKVRAAKLRKQWLPTLLSWRRVFLGKDTKAQEKVRRELNQTASAELVGLLETQLSPYDQQLALTVVDSLAGVKEQVATESLVRHAVMSKWSSVRTAATNQLKKRPLHGYVPILIDAMMSPYQFNSWSVRSPLDEDNVVALNYSVGQKGKHADHLLNGTVNILGAPDRDSADDIREELRDRINELNEAAEQFNEPIWQVLKSTTGQNLENDPSKWNDWWNDYNEYHIPEYKPVFTSYQRTSAIIPIRPYSCFPAGTLVSTQTGRKPIEDIRVGDYVLSQNPVSGELAYRPVLQTSERQSDAIMAVAFNSETLLVTRGHPVWVNGRQWQMAKQMRRGDILHGVDRPVKVDAIRSATINTAVYNLVVADFHTYFVGNSRVLVHDNSIYSPPGVSVPGQ